MNFRQIIIATCAMVVSSSLVFADSWNTGTGGYISSNSTTKVGIGTTGSTAKNMLDVKGAAVVGATYSGTNTAPANGLLIEGNVGIGLTAPVAKLDVNGQIKSGAQVAYGTPAISGYVNSATSQAVGIAGGTGGTGTYTVGTAGVENANGTYNIAGWFWSQGTSGNRYGVLAYANGGTHSYPAGQWAGAFMGNAFVEKDLQVNGKIKINNNWSIETPDYVFAKDYKLRDLGEVDKYIEKNKHLPEVPSAEEMKKSGVDLAQMNMTLLKKVEELTLYVIAQNKKIKEVEAKTNLK
jgi:hypothetical protein